MDNLKPLLLLVPFGLCILVGEFPFTPNTAWTGCAAIAIIAVIWVFALRAQTRTNVELPYWTPTIVSAKQTACNMMEMSVSAANLHHVSRQFDLPSWGVEITQVKKGSLYKITVEAPYQILSTARGVTQEDHMRWYLQGWARANGVELDERETQ